MVQSFTICCAVFALLPGLVASDEQKFCTAAVGEVLVDRGLANTTLRRPGLRQQGLFEARQDQKVNDDNATKQM